jgi:hypothetical protein
MKGTNTMRGQNEVLVDFYTAAETQNSAKIKTAIARQRRSKRAFAVNNKHASAVTNKYATMEEHLEETFPM